MLRLLGPHRMANNFKVADSLTQTSILTGTLSKTKIITRRCPIDNPLLDIGTGEQSFSMENCGDKSGLSLNDFLSKAEVLIKGLPFKRQHFEIRDHLTVNFTVNVILNKFESSIFSGVERRFSHKKAIYIISVYSYISDIMSRFAVYYCFQVREPPLNSGKNRDFKLFQDAVDSKVHREVIQNFKVFPLE
jgi:hypothetical protein